MENINMKQKIVYLDEKHCKKIKLYTQKYKAATGEFCSMGKFVEKLIDSFCQMNLQIMLGKYEERCKEDQELLNFIDEECGNIIKEFKIGEK